MKSYKYKIFSILIIIASFLIDSYAQEQPFSSIRVGSIYFDETEVDVGSWLSYYSWTLTHKGFEAAQKVLPDSNAVEQELWTYIKDKTNDNIEILARYSLQPVGHFRRECDNERTKFSRRLSNQRQFCSMLAFPITGITYEQAVRFCEWRTKVQGNYRFIFRLPTKEEWRNFALNCLNETEQRNGFRDSLNKKNCATFNFKISCCCGDSGLSG